MQIKIKVPRKAIRKNGGHGSGRERERTLTPISTPNLTTTTTTTTMDHHANPSPSPSSLSPRHHPGYHPFPAISPQWGHQETVTLIAIRGELERDFSASKRNKSLWETVASRMRQKGFNRTPYQCKCKWKNLLIRYKGKETLDPVSGKQCPFFEELQAVFSERAKIMHETSMESRQIAGAQSRKKIKSDSGDQFLDYLSQEGGDEEGDTEDEILMRSNNTRKRKISAQTAAEVKPVVEISTVLDRISSSNSMEELLRVFFEQQQKIDMQWREAMERHRHERELFEQEWRQSMEKLERERLTMEKEWREREEQWKMREEIRAEKMDALLTTLLNKLISEE